MSGRNDESEISLDKDELQKNEEKANRDKEQKDWDLKANNARLYDAVWPKHGWENIGEKYKDEKEKDLLEDGIQVKSDKKPQFFKPGYYTNTSTALINGKEVKSTATVHYYQEKDENGKDVYCLKLKDKGRWSDTNTPANYRQLIDFAGTMNWKSIEVDLPMGHVNSVMRSNAKQLTEILNQAREAGMPVEFGKGTEKFLELCSEADKQNFYHMRDAINAHSDHVELLRGASDKERFKSDIDNISKIKSEYGEGNNSKAEYQEKILKDGKVDDDTFGQIQDNDKKFEFHEKKSEVLSETIAKLDKEEESFQKAIGQIKGYQKSTETLLNKPEELAETKHLAKERWWNKSKVGLTDKNEVIGKINDNYENGNKEKIEDLCNDMREKVEKRGKEYIAIDEKLKEHKNTLTQAKTTIEQTPENLRTAPQKAQIEKYTKMIDETDKLIKKIDIKPDPVTNNPTHTKSKDLIKEIEVRSTENDKLEERIHNAYEKADREERVKKVK